MTHSTLGRLDIERLETVEAPAVPVWMTMIVWSVVIVIVVASTC